MSSPTNILTEQRTPAGPNAILAVVLTGYLMIVLDLSIIFTGLPEIGRSMALGPVALSWVHNAYLLSFGGFLLLAARLGDIIGRKTMLRAGIAIFSVASLAIGLAGSPALLIGARAVQGVGAAILAPAVLAVLSDTFPEGEERSRALAWYSMVAGAGASLGLVLGGIFAGLLSWRVGFLINVPVGLVLYLAAERTIPDGERDTGRIDVAGAIASTIGMTALVYGIVRSAEAGWGDNETLAVLASGLAALAGFVAWESRVGAPILPLRLFRTPERTVAYLGRMLFVGSVMAFFYFTTQLMQTALGYTPVQAGFGFLPMTVLTFLTALQVPRIASRIGNASVLVLAFACLGGGMLWLGQAGAGASYWSDLALPMLVIGVGNGAALAPLTTFGVAGVDARDQGAASGLVNAAHQLGGSLGLGILVVVFAAANVPGLTEEAQLAHRIDAVLTGGAVMDGLGLILTLLFIWPAERRSPAHQGS